MTTFRNYPLLSCFRQLRDIAVINFGNECGSILFCVPAITSLGLASQKPPESIVMSWTLETYKGPAVTAIAIIRSRPAKKIFLETYWVQIHSPGLSIGTTPPIFGYTVELPSLTIRELNSYTPKFPARDS